MKSLYKYLIFSAIFMLSACELTDLDHLDNPNEVTSENAELGLFFTRVQLDFRNMFINATDVGMEVTRMMAMTGGFDYNSSYTPVSFNALWNNAYANLLPDLDEMIRLAEDPENPLPFYAGVAKSLKAYALMTLVDFFGDVPFSQAGQGIATPSPTADDDKSVYDAALVLIDAAITDFGNAAVTDSDKIINKIRMLDEAKN